MQRKVKFFLEQSFEAGGYYHTLQTFLLKKHRRGISPHTVARLFHNLYPIGQSLNDLKPIEIEREWLIGYVNQCWLRYAPDTMRTLVGDVRQFFRWLKKKGYHKKNIAKSIRPPRRNHRRNRRARAVCELDIFKLVEYLADDLSGLVYRDVFGMFGIVEWPEWKIRERLVVRDLFIVVFLYETGARAGELSNLGTRTMNEVTQRPQSVYMVTMIGKTNDRDRYFTERTAELWRLWQQIRPNQSIYAVGDGTKAFAPAGISAMLDRKSRTAGAVPFRANALRHAKIKRSRKLVGLETASLLVDHSDIATTRGYANVDDDELVDAVLKTGLRNSPL